MFSVCRVPGHQSDSLSQVPDSHSPYARQVVVLIHDHFYTIEVYDDTWTRTTPDRIEKLLFACVRDVEQRLDQATPIGVLTADDRSLWAQVCHQHVSENPRLLTPGRLELLPASSHVSDEPKYIPQDPRVSVLSQPRPLHFPYRTGAE